jgi:hypothetical protein
METMISLLALIAGLLIRLAIPLAITALLIFFLRKLDAYWQSQAQITEPVNQEVNCWEIKGCTPEQRKNCIATQSNLPCWQAKRLPNGYLHEECLSCEVFTEAPMPALKTEPRRI